MMSSSKFEITVVGGGSSAHVLIPLLAQSDYKINLVARKPEQWADEIELQHQDTDGNVLKTIRGNLDKVSNNPEDIMGNETVIILCMPVNQYRIALHHIAPHINPDKKVYIGTVYGQGGFDWMVDEIKETFNLDLVVPFSIGLIPWICRTIKYGEIGVTYGAKPINIAAVDGVEHFDFLNEKVFKKIGIDWFGKGKFLHAENFLSLTLSVDNQIIHPSRCYGLFDAYNGEWDSFEEIPYFYRDFDQNSADVLHRLDADYSKIRQAIIKKYPDKNFEYMLDYQKLNRDTNKTKKITILETFTLSKRLGAIRVPAIETEKGRWKIDTNHRFFVDDIHYGLCIAKWIAEQLEVDVPEITHIIEWAQNLRGERLIENGMLTLDSEDLSGKFKSGIPYYYGSRTIDDILGIRK